MGIYDQICAQLSEEYLHHCRSIMLLNASARAFKANLAHRLGTDERNIELGHGTADTFESITSFPPNEGRTEILVSVRVTFPLGTGNDFRPVTSVSFRANRNNLRITVERHGERQCGQLAAQVSRDDLQIVLNDFEHALQTRVSGFIDKIKQ